VTCTRPTLALTEQPQMTVTLVGDEPAQYTGTFAVTADNDVSGTSGLFRQLRHLAEPAFVIPLYVLAVVGLFLVPGPFRVLALLFVGYETLAAWVFAGTTRYRVPWDFVLALLAAAALTRIPLRRRAARQKGSESAADLATSISG
jgi:hypothetical protein